MEQYDNVILYVLKLVIVGNAILFGIILLAIVISLIFKNKLNYKKIINVCLTILLCGIAEFSFFTIPRVIDIKKQDYIVIENATITINAMNEYDGSFLVYGIGKVKDTNGDSITLTGTELIGLPTDESSEQVLKGTIIYGKNSKQIVSFSEN